MILARGFLALNGALFLGYGLACLADPSIVASLAGLIIPGGQGAAELRAMYGGLQSSIGLIALAGSLRRRLTVPGLVVLAFVLVGLAVGRLIGIAVEDAPGRYNVATFGYEAVSAVLCLALLSRANVGRAGTQPAAAP